MADMFLPIRELSGGYIAYPGFMVLAATLASSPDDIWREYQALVAEDGADAAQRRDRRARKKLRMRGYAGNILKELWRSSELEARVSSLSEAQSRVACHSYAHRKSGGRIKSHGELSEIWRQHGDAISREIDDVRKGWRNFKSVSHYIAAVWTLNHTENKFIERLPNDAFVAEKALGLAKSFQRFIEQKCPTLDVKLVRVPEEIVAVPLRRISLADAFSNDPMPPRVVRHHK
ncbi:hypothetical protein [Seohaeicola zhoushanensis]|uniref:Uncharacterized protein n=1 Tax=Seohaeicola zhoushanensis TaxID=1569283 RepID=A0A8J3GZR3_9RHOB|nr:hypothetical protein [Seohaeicola zhoushanensis]GHF64405.1 hypothetical protein GCM10017056_39610 [Seohaeicola zhoushanensis]